MPLTLPKLSGPRPFPEVSWSASDKPVLILDGRVHRIKDLREPVAGDLAYLVGVNAKTFSVVCEWVRARAMHFYEMRVAELSPLAEMATLEQLSIHWNPKLEHLEPLAALSQLRVLALIDTPKVRDLEPLASLASLAVLTFEGGMSKCNRVETIEPIARIPRLAGLRLASVKVESGGLKPLAGATGLEELELPNTFDTEDYAYLSVMLPETNCDYFAPYVSTPSGFLLGDTMVVGRRKPFLNSAADGARLTKYRRAFEALQTRFRQELAAP